MQTLSHDSPCRTILRTAAKACRRFSTGQKCCLIRHCHQQFGYMGVFISQTSCCRIQPDATLFCSGSFWVPQTLPWTTPKPARTLTKYYMHWVELSNGLMCVVSASICTITDAQMCDRLGLLSARTRRLSPRLSSCDHSQILRQIMANSIVVSQVRLTSILFATQYSHISKLLQLSMDRFHQIHYVQSPKVEWYIPFP